MADRALSSDRVPCKRSRLPGLKWPGSSNKRGGKISCVALRFGVLCVDDTTLPFRLRIRIYEKGEKFSFCAVGKHWLKSVLNMKRFLPRPGNSHHGPFLFNVVHRDTPVGNGIDNAQGTQANGHSTEYLGTP